MNLKKSKINLNFRKAIDDYNLLARDDKVVISFSGGPDSVLLACLLLEIQKTFNLKLLLAYFNHQLRGCESDKEENFVKNFARTNGFRLKSFKIEPLKLSKKWGVSVEEAARELRYGKLLEVAVSEGFNKIALGHNFDDNVETVLFNIIRGTSLGGLKGIPPKRLLNSKIMLIRPLIRVRKKDAAACLEAEKIKFIVDSTNSMNIFTRNKIRNEVIPLLEKVNVNAKLHIANLSDDAALWDEFKDTLVSDMLAKCLKGDKFLDLAAFFGYHKFLRKEVVAALWGRYGKKPLEREYIAKISAKLRASFREGETVVDIPDIFDCVDQKKCRLPYDAGEYSFNPKGSTFIEPLGIVVSCVLLDKSPLSLKSGPARAYFDWCKLNKDLPFTVRFARPGDKYRPFGFKGRKKVLSLLAEAGVPKASRSSAPVVLCGPDIIWVAGSRTSDASKVDSTTKKILEIGIRRKFWEKNY